MKLKLSALSALAIVSMMSANPSFAGESTLLDGRCVVSNAPNLTCSGSFAGTSNKPDKVSSVSFTLSTLDVRRFEINVGGAIHACVAPASMRIVWAAAMATVGFFSVEIDPSGVCKIVKIWNGSQYRNTSSL